MTPATNGFLNSLATGVTIGRDVLSAHGVKAYPDVVRTFTNLLDASQYGHLPAFLRCS